MCSLANSVSSRVDRLPFYRRRGSTRVPLPPELALRAAPPENRGAQALLHTAGPCLKGSTPYLGTRVLPPRPDDVPLRRHGHDRDGPALQPDARRPRPEPRAHGAADDLLRRPPRGRVVRARVEGRSPVLRLGPRAAATGVEITPSSWRRDEIISTQARAAGGARGLPNLVTVCVEINQCVGCTR